jgi:hypothetical protein
MKSMGDTGSFMRNTYKYEGNSDKEIRGNYRDLRELIQKDSGRSREDTGRSTRYNKIYENMGRFAGIFYPGDSGHGHKFLHEGTFDELFLILALSEFYVKIKFNFAQS